ncbi:MAG: flagellar biosynthesis protein FlhA [Myxococcota bacterium]
MTEEPVRLLGGARRYANAILAALVVLMVGMMIIPLPTPLLDVLLASNIAAAVVLLLVSLYVRRGLQLSVLPTLLLLTTLYRVALNVSSTRLILLQADAGQVIEAFGEFVVQGNYVVGAVVFLILTLVQFVVIAKGSERIAEVGARFTLDAMPGKQLAIDAELRSGIVDRAEAKAQRANLQRESDFYGAMDGAMKFVKGDAIVGVIITAINIIGGLGIGVGLQDMPFQEALRTYGLLTIGDGLVSQIPALLISTSAGLVVTRVKAERDQSLAGTIASQIFGQARALLIGAGFLLLLAFLPGLPFWPFLALAALLLLIAVPLLRSRRDRIDEDPGDVSADPAVEPLRIDVPDALRGKILRPFYDQALPSLRRTLMEERGLPLPPVTLRASAIASGTLRILVHGVERRKVALTSDDPATEVADVLGSVLRQEGERVLSVQQVSDVLARLRKSDPALVDAASQRIDVVRLTVLLRALLRERVSLRPLTPILEALASAPRGHTPTAEELRRTLGERISLPLAVEGTLRLWEVDPLIEDALRESAEEAGTEQSLALAPELARDIGAAVRASGAEVIAIHAELRPLLSQLLAHEAPETTVIAWNEVAAELTLERVGRIEV